jgi:SagB-type dehydrogenase family enzyme
LKADILDAKAIAQQFLGDEDLQSMMPVAPRLLPELLLLPFGRDGLLISGGNATRLLKCPGAQDQLLDVLREIDGRRSMQDLLREVDTPIEGGVFGVLSMMVRYGFVEDAEGLGEHDPADMTGSFLGRFLDASRINGNRQEAKDRLAAERIAVLCYEGYADQVAQLLSASGVGAATVIRDANEIDALAPTFVLAIGLGSRWNATEQAVMAEACARSIPILMSCIGEQLVRIGPLVLPGVTCGPDCVGMQLDHFEPAATGSETDAWASYVAHEAILTLSQIAPSGYLNATQEHRRDLEGYYTRRLKLARVPGSPTGGLARARPLATRDPAFTAWAHHAGVRMPPRRYLHPRAHQEHYSAANLVGYTKALPQVSAKRTLGLPEALALHGEPRWLGGRHDSAAPLAPALDALATVLRMAVGNMQLQDGGVRRVAPSGGGLKSTNFYIHASGIDGLEDGIYSYNSNEHALEPIPLEDPQDLIDALPAAANANGPGVWVVSVAHLERVRNKYNDFSYNVAHLDAGVSLTFARETASALGWSLQEHPQFNTVSLGRLLRTHGTDNCQLATYAFQLRPASSPPAARAGRSETIDALIAVASQATPTRASVPVELDPAPVDTLRRHTGGQSLERIMAERRARYRFGEAAVPGELLAELLAQSLRRMGERLGEGAPGLPIVPWVLRPRGDEALPAGIYEVRGPRICDWVMRDEKFADADMLDCINQVSLSKAGVIVTFVADLEAILHRFGPAGYRQALVDCGAAVSHAWLMAQGAGLVGTAAGGIIEHGLMVRTGLDGYTESPLFSLALAVAPEPQAVSQVDAHD